MAKERISLKEMKRDRFREIFDDTLTFAVLHWKKIAIGLAGLVLIAAVFAGVVYVREGNIEENNFSFERAYSGYQSLSIASNMDPNVLAEFHRNCQDVYFKVSSEDQVAIVRILEGNMFILEKRSDQAMALYQKAYDEDPEGFYAPLALYRQAMLYEDSQEPNALTTAREILRRIEIEFSGSAFLPMVIYSRGVLLEAQQDYNGAREAYNGILRRWDRREFESRFLSLAQRRLKLLPGQNPEGAFP